MRRALPVRVAPPTDVRASAFRACVPRVAPSVLRSITMVTPEVDETSKARLRAAGSHVVPVDLIAPPWKISASWWETVFTKLQIFSLGNTSAGRVDQVRVRVTHMIASVIASLARYRIPLALARSDSCNVPPVRLQVAFVDLDAFIVSERADTVFDACDATEVSRS